MLLQDLYLGPPLLICHVSNNSFFPWICFTPFVQVKDPTVDMLDSLLTWDESSNTSQACIPLPHYPSTVCLNFLGPGFKFLPCLWDLTTECSWRKILQHLLVPGPTNLDRGNQRHELWSTYYIDYQNSWGIYRLPPQSSIYHKMLPTHCAVRAPSVEQCQWNISQGPICQVWSFYLNIKIRYCYYLINPKLQSPFFYSLQFLANVFCEDCNLDCVWS